MIWVLSFVFLAAGLTLLYIANDLFHKWKTKPPADRTAIKITLAIWMLVLGLILLWLFYTAFQSAVRGAA